MQGRELTEVLEELGIEPRRIRTLKDVAFENASWLVETRGGDVCVLRRYHDQATVDDLVYEHAVLSHLAEHGWVVPNPIGDLVSYGNHWYCPTRYVPGEPVQHETPEQRRRRGRDLARLHVAMRDLGGQLGQRPWWRPQHTAVTCHEDIDWDACLRDLAQAHPELANWARHAAEDTHEKLAALGAADLPLTVVHGDFAEWNVHYDGDRLAGVVDFGLTHLDSRPYELAIARTYRSPEAVDAYRDELASSHWPLSELEEAAIAPVYWAFRVDMVAWQLALGRRQGFYDVATIEGQLVRTGTTL
jgi:homoserine kinase type II